MTGSNDESPLRQTELDTCSAQEPQEAEKANQGEDCGGVQQNAEVRRCTTSFHVGELETSISVQFMSSSGLTGTPTLLKSSVVTIKINTMFDNSHE